MTNENDRSVKWEVRPTPAARVNGYEEGYKKGFADGVNTYKARIDLIQIYLQRLEQAVEELARKVEGLE